MVAQHRMNFDRTSTAPKVTQVESEKSSRMFCLLHRARVIRPAWLIRRSCSTQTPVEYEQGQSPEPRIREYFYYIDHEGMLFLDDARIKNFTSCFKEKRFLQFFFKRVKFNDTSRYQKEFPYLSLCGRERNFIRCDDVPIVYTETIADADSHSLSYAHTGGELVVPFEPDKIFMAPETGRVYHPGKEQYGSIGLIRSRLAIEFSAHFEFGNGEKESPTHFTWNGVRHTLDNRWLEGIKLAPGREKL